ncbi:MAG: lipid-A-disaccharide synthase [Selenomonadales bacterium]|nr:lipid-A-disaccharide synthase [Selenomonadales bacterium]
MLKVMFSVGEASGDLHGGRVARELKQNIPDIEMFGMGGQTMREAGVDICYDIADLGVIGVAEVIKNLPRFFKLRDDLGRLMDERKPDVVVVIDYADFNMRLAKVAKDKGIPVVSYISPSAWLWRKGRAKTVAKNTARVAAIFPMEAKVYEEAGANVTFVGHPLLDIVKPTRTKEEAYRHYGADSASPIVLLLPGSRLQEINSLLPPMLEAAETIAQRIPNVQFYLPLAPTVPDELVAPMLERVNINVNCTRDGVHDLMQIATMGIAASGTVTLEAAILEMPMVVVYKVAKLTYWIGRVVLDLPNYSLPNIVGGRRIVPELIQHEANPERIVSESMKLLEDDAYYRQMKEGLADVRRRLGEGGAVAKVARVIEEVGNKEK